MVTDTQSIDYKSDDGGDQNDPRVNPINPEFLNMELRRPFCTPGISKQSILHE